jgi:oxygen-independent coproporphyrinogen-3 oxidase
LANDLSVYLHIPFCLSKCPYCDFYSAAVGEMGVSPEEYFNLVTCELEILCEQQEKLLLRPLVTFYVGGGTPSLVEPGFHERVYEYVGALFLVDASLEWTLEVNPGTLDADRTTDNGQRTIDNKKRATSNQTPTTGIEHEAEQRNKLEEFLALGVNRLSIGVQSFSDETLRRLGRAHRSAETRALLDCLRQGKFQKTDRRPFLPDELIWAIDLIFGAPSQTLDMWQSDLDEAIAYRPHHISVYGMTIHEGTPFGDLRRAGRLDLPDEETQREMFLLARRRLIAAGYEHYEISNYALPGFRSRHNERYWTGGDYLGLGVAAHSYVGGVRWSNPPDMSYYRESLEAGRLPRRIEPPPEGRARLGEQVMLGLRRLEGIDLGAFCSRTGEDLTQTYSDEIAGLLDAGLIEIGDGKLRLTEEGLLVADAVMAKFF